MRIRQEIGNQENYKSKDQKIHHEDTEDTKKSKRKRTTESTLRHFADPPHFARVRSPCLSSCPSCLRGESLLAFQTAAEVSTGSERGATPRTASAIARMCAGVVPQQPPTRFTRPLLANSPIVAAICSGVSSYSPNV